MFNPVLQLADIARPGIGLDLTDGLGGETGIVRLDSRQEMPGEQQDVLSPLPERSHMKRKNGYPVIEIFAETALLHHPLKIPVRGGHNARLDGEPLQQ